VSHRFTQLTLILTFTFGLVVSSAMASPSCDAGELRRLVNRIHLVEKRIQNAERRTETAIEKLYQRARYGLRSVNKQIQHLSSQYDRELRLCDDGNPRACSRANVTREIIEGLQETKDMIIPSNTKRLAKLYHKRYLLLTRPLQRKLKRAKRFVRTCLPSDIS